MGVYQTVEEGQGKERSSARNRKGPKSGESSMIGRVKLLREKQVPVRQLQEKLWR